MFSVIVPIHNRLILTKRCIESILKYSPPDIELICWDDGSTDGTLEYLRSINFPNLKIFYTNKAVGVARNCHYMGLECTKPYICSFNSDVEVLEEGWYLTAIAELEKPYVGIVGPSGQHFNLADGSYVEADYGEVDGLTGYCHFYRRDLLELGLQQDFFYASNPYGDIDFCFQVRELGYKVVKIYMPIAHEWGGSWDKTKWEPNKKYFLEKWQ